VRFVPSDWWFDALKRPSPLILSELRRKGIGIAVIRNSGKSFVIGGPPRDNQLRIWTHWKCRRREKVRSRLT
jgi:hypothetical protein